MHREADAFIAPLANGVALTGFVSVLSLSLFFAVHGPFGAITSDANPDPVPLVTVWWRSG